MRILGVVKFMVETPLVGGYPPKFNFSNPLFGAPKKKDGEFSPLFFLPIFRRKKQQQQPNTPPTDRREAIASASCAPCIVFTTVQCFWKKGLVQVVQGPVVGCEKNSGESEMGMFFVFSHKYPREL